MEISDEEPMIFSSRVIGVWRNEWPQCVTLEGQCYNSRGILLTSMVSCLVGLCHTYKNQTTYKVLIATYMSLYLISNSFVPISYSRMHQIRADNKLTMHFPELYSCPSLLDWHTCNMWDSEISPTFPVSHAWPLALRFGNVYCLLAFMILSSEKTPDVECLLQPWRKQHSTIETNISWYW
ncbi:hypothetical protein L211DRAFT_638295 [Terfezia boudieri ATCC MYA-4762]|uniref:Uncharacterized protein n=1 Tax=Terfezia boudieri ATCC MYA-4762 TaxID=1051890 RepID=A0A3N4L8Y5_9PEZI|nr:hypothetical protein L211DRAFT_638295 [Terfezia boudieri ATCC MYA-4762]